MFDLLLQFMPDLYIMPFSNCSKISVSYILTYLGNQGFVIFWKILKLH